MDPMTTGLIALLKHGGIFAVAVLASYLALDYRKELRTVHEKRETRERENQDKRAEELKEQAAKHASEVKDLEAKHAERVESMLQTYKTETGKLQGIIGSLQKRVASQESARVDDLKAQAEKWEQITREITAELTLGRQAMEAVLADTDDDDQGGSA